MSQPALERGRAGRMGVFLLVLLALPPTGQRQSGLQITPDRSGTLVSKDVGEERWAITLNQDGSVTGNVFFPGGGKPQFVWCEQTGRTDGNLLFTCSGADECPITPCSANQWVFIADVSLPEAFFLPPSPLAGPAPDGALTAGLTRPSADAASAPAGVQENPPHTQTIISKDVGEERWAITYALEDGSVTGNVFFPGGGEPKFVWCTRTGEAGAQSTFDCYGADPCAAAPCREEDWTFLSQVTLPTDFFFAPDQVSLQTVGETLVDTLGEEDGFDALVLAVDRGYSLRQIASAVLSGRISSTGEITWKSGAAEEPEGPPIGFFYEEAASTAGSPGTTLATSLSEARRKAFETIDALGRRNYYAVVVLTLLSDGYSLEQTMSALIEGRIQVVGVVGLQVVDDQGKRVLPASERSNVFEPSPSPSPSPTPTATPSVTPSPTPAPLCGDGVAGEDEECDGSDLRGADCESVGYAGGELRCTPGCRYDTSACDDCGNGTRGPGEECDGDDFGGLTCPTAGDFTGGDLACTIACRIDTSDCTKCSDGVAEGTEDCDGADLRATTCDNLGFTGGTLSCDATCSFDTSGCISCGNGERDQGEDCDASDLAGASCESLGFDAGTLSCDSSCSFDTSSCCFGKPCHGGCIGAADDCCADGTYCVNGVCAPDGCCPLQAPNPCVGTPYCCPDGWTCVFDGCCPNETPISCGNGMCVAFAEQCS